MYEENETPVLESHYLAPAIINFFSVLLEASLEFTGLPGSLDVCFIANLVLS